MGVLIALYQRLDTFDSVEHVLQPAMCVGVERGLPRPRDWPPKPTGLVAKSLVLPSAQSPKLRSLLQARSPHNSAIALDPLCDD